MSLRIRLFLVLGALIAALVLAHGWLVRSLAGELTAELDVVALDVGEAVARALSPGEPVKHHVQVLHVTGESERKSDGSQQLDEATQTPPPSPPRRRGSSPQSGTLDTEKDGDWTPAFAGETVKESRANEKSSSPEKVRGTETERRGPSERIVVRKIVRGDMKAGKGYSYYYTSKKADELPLPEGATPGEIQHEQLIIKLGDPAQGALHLQGPGLAAEVPIPRLGLQEKLAEFERKILFGSAVLLLAGLLAAAYLAHRVSAPLLRLSQAAVAVGGGDLGATVDERAGSSEVRDALGAFNRMSSRLRELSQQNRRLLQERHLGEIGEIARGLAHSLRNPLHALGLSVDEIAGGALASGSAAGELAAAARRQIGKLDRSIRSFLVFASQGDAHPQPVELGALAEDVALEALQDRHTGVRVEIVRVEIGKGPGELTLPAVEQELRAIVQALLVNAIEASPPGETVLLRVGRGEGPGRLRVEIEDSGEGLAPEVRERLFTPHVTTKASGSGMGLFLAQRLAAGRYDGSLELHDRDGGGTRAILELGPRAAPGAEP
jgi:signal transduction histidine kinase